MSERQDPDYQDHVRMWHTFVRLVTISAVAVAVTLLILAATVL